MASMTSALSRLGTISTGWPYAVRHPSRYCRARPAPTDASAPRDTATATRRVVPRKRRRGDRAGQDAKPRAAVLGEPRALRGQDGQHILPIGGQTARRDPPRPIRVVKIEHLRLRERIRGAQARRMLRISLHLDRPPHLMLDHDAGGIAVQHVGSAVEIRQSRNDVRGHPHRRNQIPSGAPASQPPSPPIAKAAAISLQHPPAIAR